MAIYCSGLRGIRSHRAVRGPLPLPSICFLRFLPGLRRGCHPTVTADPHGRCRKGPRCSTYSKAAEFPTAQKKSVGISGISFLLSVKYVRVMQRSAALDLFPLQRSCFYPFSPLSSARLFCLYIASYRQFQQFPVGFGRRIVKKFHAIDRNRNSW